MELFLTIPQAQSFLRKQLRTKRLAHGLTQSGLAKRSGVPLPTLRKFEQKGKISLESLLKLLLALNELDKFANALKAQDLPEYRTTDDVVKDRRRPPRKYGYRE